MERIKTLEFRVAELKGMRGVDPRAKEINALGPYVVQMELLQHAFKSTESIAALIYDLHEADAFRPEDLKERFGSMATARTVMSRLRHILKRRDIELQSHYNSGYWLDAEGKSKLMRALIDCRAERLPYSGVEAEDSSS